MKTRFRYRYLILVLIPLALLLIVVAIVMWQSKEGPGKLAVRWEGFVNDANARDVGMSINRCLDEKFMTEQRLYRAAQWFSGWSCNTVGNPDVILSLNYRPGLDEHFYCRKNGANVVGQFSNFGPELSELELVETWNNPEVKESACWYFKEGMKAIVANQRLLIHCDAGRDRTGTYAAIMTALAAETAHRLDDKMLQAIECDYRRTPSLVQEKYGRMQRFISQLQRQGGVAQFLQTNCGLEPTFIARVGEALLAKNTPLMMNPQPKPNTD